ncbi:MAG: hypothetical protein ACF8LL_05105 [Phycisphaerales bacterium]
MLKSLFAGSVELPKVVLWLLIVALVGAAAFAGALATDRNPLPFPDRDYHVFSASSLQGLVALEEVMAAHGNRPRFRIDSENVDRTVFYNGTIINSPQGAILEQLKNPAGALGFVVPDPDEAAEQAAELLRRHGFEAEVVRNAEPGLPITFVTTDALLGAALVYRKHVLRMGPPPPAWTPRTAE